KRRKRFGVFVFFYFKLTGSSFDNQIDEVSCPLSIYLLDFHVVQASQTNVRGKPRAFACSHICRADASQINELSCPSFIYWLAISTWG
ncbi:hypothetical protein RLK11_00290, partial [Streptococcus pneumoniae]|nr:hypothetical protein [Streptococcus pneumoniae]